jgi:site-specific recombinase XerD
MITLAYHMEWPEREYLTELELGSIEALSPSVERLEVVKDLFVFSCYTGISYADIMKLTNEHIVLGIDGNKWIMANRNKTGIPFKIPLLSKAEIIIAKYYTHPRTQFSGKLLPGLSNQRLNSYLKEIAILCSIEKNLTFHLARHTFATTVTSANGIPIESVSKMLGHQSLKTTQIYAKVIDKKLRDDMNILRRKYQFLK